MKRGFFAYLIWFVLTSPMLAQSEEDLDDMYLNESSSGSFSESSVEVYGYLESENVYAPYFKKTSKLELRDRTTVKAGSSFFYGLATADVFFYPDMEGLGNPHNSGEISLYELYISAGNKVQFRAGQMVFNWGNADAFRIVNFPDRRDLTELFFKEEDERYGGTVALSLKALFGDFAAEVLFLPYLNPFSFPGSNSFWALRPADILGQTPDMDVASMPDNKPENFSYAARFGGTFGELDFHLSYFHGISNTIVFTPNIEYALPGKTLQSILVSPKYFISDKIGLDTAFTVGKLSGRVEVLYSPNQVAAVKNKFDSETAGTTLTMSQKTARTDYAAYTAGFDYNLWGNNGTVLIEYTNSHYLSNRNLEDEFFSNFLMITVKDKWFQEKLEVNAGVLLRPAEKNIGYVPMLSFIWTMQDSLSMTGGYMAFIGNGDTVISMYKNHDIFYLKIKASY